MGKRLNSRWSEFKGEGSINNLYADFLAPPDEFKPVPWLCFNSKLTVEEVFRSIDMMFEQGISSFFIFPVYGMGIEYLSNEWFDLVKQTVAYCEEVGMSVWIYDDYAWPAGNCGGKLIQQHPEFNKRNVYCEAFDVAPSELFSKEIFGILLRCSILCDGKLEEVAVELKDDTVLWTNNTGRKVKLIVVNYAECKQPGMNWAANKGSLWQKENGLSNEYIDWLNSDAIDCFIDMTYERYYNELKPYWGSVIKGFMCDEPSFFGIHYNEKLHLEFEKRYGYKIEKNYEHLFVLINEKTYQVRADYRRLAGEMLGKNIQKINNWCLKHEVDFTGHYLGEESPGQEVASQSDSWSVRKNMSIPGMDVLCLDSNYHPVPMIEYSFKKHFYPPAGLALTAKTTAATARYTGSGRAFVEAYGVSPYWVSPTDHTAHTHWLTAIGINLINDNTFSVSYEDFRKRSTGGKHFTMPWWDWYKDFVEFAGRCSLMGSIGKTPVKIGMVSPVITAQCAYSHSQFQFAENVDSAIYLESNYLAQQTADMMTRNNLAWEIVWEEHLRTGKVENGVLEFADVKLSALVLPGMHFIEKKVLDALEKFVASGGCLIFVGMLPQAIIDGEGSPVEAISRMLELSNVHFLELQSPDEWIVIKEQALLLLEKHNDKCFELFGIGLENIMAVHRIQGETEIFHFVNMSPEATEITVDIVTAKMLSLWHPDDGQRYSIKTTEKSGHKRIRLTFAPWEGYFIIAEINDSEPAEGFPLRHFEAGAGSYQTNHLPPQKMPLYVENFKGLSDLWNFKTEKPNMKALSPQVLIEDVFGFSGEDLSGETTEAKWLNTENNMTPFTLNPLEHQYFWVKTVFYSNGIPNDCAVVVDGQNYAEIYCNGKRLKNGSAITLWDFSNIKYSLTETAKNGRNVLAIKVKTSDYLHPDVRLCMMEDIIEPIVLIGNFGVNFKGQDVQLDSMPEMIYTGDWGLQGFSGYSGTATYRQEVKLSKDNRSIWLDLGNVNVGAEVFVNGKFAGRRCWPPYHYQIDDLIVNGLNTIEVKVKNTLNNLFEYDKARRPWDTGKSGQAPSGILGPVSICMF